MNDIDVLPVSGSGTRLSLLEIAGNYPERSISGFLEPHEMLMPEERIVEVKKRLAGKTLLGRVILD